MTIATNQTPAEKILPRLERVRQLTAREGFAGSYQASCPCSRHQRGDQRPSLSVDFAVDGTALLKCHSGGCTAKEIVEAIGLTMADLFPPKDGDRPHNNGHAAQKPKGRAYLTREEAIAQAGRGIALNHPGSVPAGQWDYHDQPSQY